MRLLEDLRNETLTIPRKDLPRLIGQLAELSAVAHARLVSAPEPEPREDLLTVAQAATRLG